MIISPKLKSYVRSDGTSQLIIYVYDPETGLKEEIITTHRINNADWTGSEVDKRRPNASYLNPVLKRLTLTLEEHAVNNPGITPKELKAWHEGPKLDIKHTPATYYTHFIQMCRDGLVLHKQTKERLTEGYIKAVNTSCNYFLKFSKDRHISFRGVDESLFDEFVTFQRSIGLSQNTIVKSLTHLKMIMAHSLKKGHHSNTFKEYSLSTVKSQKIRLTPEEIEAIIKLDLTHDQDLIPEWERFQVAYNLLLRFGDTISISEKNILIKDRKPYLTTFTQKTRKEVLLPIKKSVYTILKRNNFKILGTNTVSNDKLKRLGMMAKINSNVTITEFKDGKKIETVYKKYQLMETHTTRRSAARNLFDTGVDPNIIMVLGGWKSLKQLFEYIDIDLEYAASKVADHPFFK